jgi:site-specific recombinase XerD
MHIILYFAEFTPELQVFQAKVKARLGEAIRPSTIGMQNLAFRTLAMFCILFSSKFPNVSVITLLSYIEFLADNKYSVATVKNYLSACKTKFKQLQLDVIAFESNLIKYALKSLECNSPKLYKVKPILSFTEIFQLVYVLKAHPLFDMYRMAILLGFMGMLLISNVVQVSLAQFNKHKHLARGDLMLTSKGIKILLKWSKTMQTHRQGAVVILPHIPSSLMCPVNVLSALNKHFPEDPSQPLFSYRVSNKLKYVSRAKIQNLLNLAANKCNLQHSVTFHALRRSAASLAFHAGVPLEQIKAQGCWSSEAIWSYIDSSAKAVLLPQFFTLGFGI